MKRFINTMYYEGSEENLNLFQESVYVIENDLSRLVARTHPPFFDFIEAQIKEEQNLMKKYSIDYAE